MSKNPYTSNLWRKMRDYVLSRDNAKCQYYMFKTQEQNK